MLNPDILDGGEIYDKSTGLSVDGEYVKKCYREHADILSLFADLNNGMVTISLTEYQSLPDVLKQAYRIYQRTIQAKRNRDGER